MAEKRGPSVGLSDILDEYKGKPMDEIVSDLNKIPFFMTEMTDGCDNAQVDALKALAYEGEPHEIAQNFRNQGNDCFKTNRYDDAIKYYTRALDQHCTDDSINIACLGNRAQCNLELKNLRRCINDCAKVLDKDPKNAKAWYRSAKAFLLLDRNQEAIKCSELGLDTDPGNVGLLAIKDSASKRAADLEDLRKYRDEQKQHAEILRQTLQRALDQRHIKTMYSEPDKNYRSFEDRGFRLEEELDPNSQLLISILFLYPLKMESDIIRNVPEDDTIRALLEQLFGQPPAWANADYQVGELEVFAPTSSGGLAKLGARSTVGKALASQKPEIIAIDNMARFYVVPASKAKDWLGTWDKEQALAQLHEN